MFSGKAEVTARRNERLAQRNPERIRKQIDDLKDVTTNGGKLDRHQEQVLEGLEKELKAIAKARDALGDKAPSFGLGPRRDGGGAVLGKRRRDAEDAASSDSDVSADVKIIPMPRDTPPPIPKEVLDAWYAKRRARRGNPNEEPLGGEKARPRPTVEAAKTVYEARPVIRDLRKEAVSAFVPTAVRAKIDKGKGKAGLLEPEEADQLEQEGYLKRPAVPESQATAGRNVTIEEVYDEEG